MDDLFTVFRYGADGRYTTPVRDVGAEQAVRLAIVTAQTDADATRVIITDAGDCCAWEWKAAEGIVFPPQVAGRLKRTAGRDEQGPPCAS